MNGCNIFLNQSPSFKYNLQFFLKHNIELKITIVLKNIYESIIMLHFKHFASASISSMH